MTFSFKIIENAVQKMKSISIILFFVMLQLNITSIGGLFAQSPQLQDPRFIRQEDHEMEKAKTFHVKTRTAINFDHSGFSKPSQEGVINEYLIFDHNGNKTEHTTFRAGSFIDTKWIYEFDEKGNSISLQGIDNLGHLQYKRDSKYDEYNKEIERKEYKKNVRETYTGIYFYDEDGKLLKIDTYNSKDKKVWSDQYSFDGDKLIEHKSYNQDDEIAAIVKFNHNSAGLIIEEIGVSPSTGESKTFATYKYDNAGMVIENETNNFRQVFEYNTNGDVVLDIMYNKFGNRQHKFTMSYDDKGLLIERIRYSPTEKKVYTVKYEYEYF